MLRRSCGTGPIAHPARCARTLIFLAFCGVTLAAQVRSAHYHPAFYWLVVVATTTVGTTTSDYFDRNAASGAGS